jgi:hypothetical protein
MSFIWDNTASYLILVYIILRYDFSAIAKALLSDRPGSYLYSTLAYVGGDAYVLLEVLASNDAHIALSEGQDVYTSNMYEIVIGGWSNAKSAIRYVHIELYQEYINSLYILGYILSYAFYQTCFSGIYIYHLFRT